VDGRSWKALNSKVQSVLKGGHAGVDLAGVADIEAEASSILRWEWGRAAKKGSSS
jgi:hypothetical protein